MGPDLHLVGTLIILINIFVACGIFVKYHIYTCTYVNGNYNQYWSCWEIFEVGCTTTQSVNFVEIFENSIVDIS